MRNLTIALVLAAAGSAVRGAAAVRHSDYMVSNWETEDGLPDSFLRAMGKTLDQLIHTREEYLEFLKILRGLPGTGRSMGPSEFRFSRRSGEEAWCLSTIFEIPGTEGQPLLVCRDVDITDRKAAEEKVRSQLEELKRWFNLTLDREKRLLQLKREVNELLARQGEPARYEFRGELEKRSGPVDHPENTIAETATANPMKTK